MRRSETGVQPPAEGTVTQDDEDKSGQPIGVAATLTSAINRAKDTEDELELQRWQKYGVDSMDELVTIVVEPDSESQLAAIIAETGVGKNAQGNRAKTDLSYVLVHYDVAIGGETVTEPWLNTPPCRKELVKKLIRGALWARTKEVGGGLGINPGD
eukprot:5909547-Pyramimonas_sp.AAC.1